MGLSLMLLFNSTLASSQVTIEEIVQKHKLRSALLSSYGWDIGFVADTFGLGVKITVIMLCGQSQK